MMCACEKESLIVDSEKDNNECIEKSNAQPEYWWQAYRNTLRIVSFKLLTFAFHPKSSFD